MDVRRWMWGDCVWDREKEKRERKKERKKERERERERETDRDRERDIYREREKRWNDHSLSPHDFNFDFLRTDLLLHLGLLWLHGRAMKVNMRRKQKGHVREGQWRIIEESMRQRRHIHSKKKMLRQATSKMKGDRKETC
jgi:hypothetical protein